MELLTIFKILWLRLLKQELNIRSNRPRRKIRSERTSCKSVDVTISFRFRFRPRPTVKRSISRFFHFGQSYNRSTSRTPQNGTFKLLWRKTGRYPLVGLRFGADHSSGSGYIARKLTCREQSCTGIVLQPLMQGFGQEAHEDSPPAPIVEKVRVFENVGRNPGRPGGPTAATCTTAEATSSHGNCPEDEVSLSLSCSGPDLFDGDITQCQLTIASPMAAGDRKQLRLVMPPLFPSLDNSLHTPPVPLLPLTDHQRQQTPNVLQFRLSETLQHQKEEKCQPSQESRNYFHNLTSDWQHQELLKQGPLSSPTPLLPPPPPQQEQQSEQQKQEQQKRGRHHQEEGRRSPSQEIQHLVVTLAKACGGEGESWIYAKEGEAGRRRNNKRSSTTDTVVNTLPRYKRPAHIHAEYRRREKIQKGFDLVQTLVPTLQGSASTKHSKATMLEKSVEYLRELTNACAQQKAEMQTLLAETHALQNELMTYQQQLPSSGIDVKRPSCFFEHMIDEYMQRSIAQDWKFWIFSFIARPLSQSFLQCVTSTSKEHFFQSTQEWCGKNLTLVNLRTVVISLLRTVSTTTSILTEPEKLKEEVAAMLEQDLKTVPDSLTDWNHLSEELCEESD